MPQKNVEIENVKKIVSLLKQYDSAPTQQEKDDFLKQLYNTNVGAHTLITKYGYKPVVLANRLKKAVLLDKYRPKNMSFIKLATSKDLDNIKGEFDTFDSKLSKMLKDKENPKVIRERFMDGVANVYFLAKQFAIDWLNMLDNHKDLVEAARNAKESEAAAIYDKLFFVLSQDFCKKYDCHIDSRVVTDWGELDNRHPDLDLESTLGIHQYTYGLALPSGLPESEREKIKKVFQRKPSDCPYAYKASSVRINITNVRKKRPEPTDFFYSMICFFAHEMHHALDYEHPRQGALGSQIEYIDGLLYTLPSKTLEKDTNAYYESATEISSYNIQHELYSQLRNRHF